MFILRFLLSIYFVIIIKLFYLLCINFFVQCINLIINQDLVVNNYSIIYY